MFLNNSDEKFEAGGEMAKTLVIELPDNWEQQLMIQTDVLNKPLESVFLKTSASAAPGKMALKLT